MRSKVADFSCVPLLRLQVFIFSCDILDARTRLRGGEVVVTDDAGAGVAPVQLFKEPSHGSLLLRCPCVVVFTTVVQTALIAHADAVPVVLRAVCAYEPFGPASLYLSVTADDVVVADAVLPVVILPVPRVYLGCRTRLVGLYRTAVNDN